MDTVQACIARLGAGIERANAGPLKEKFQPFVRPGRIRALPPFSPSPSQRRRGRGEEARFIQVQIPSSPTLSPLGRGEGVGGSVKMQPVPGAPVLPVKKQQTQQDDGRDANADRRQTNRSSGSEPRIGSRSCAERISTLPGKEVRAMTCPPPVTACEMPELASGKWECHIRRAHGRDPRVKLVLVPDPLFNIHCRHDEQLRALLHQPVGDAGVTQVVADADARSCPKANSRPPVWAREGRL